MSESTPAPATAAQPSAPHRPGLIAWRNAVFAIFFLSGLSVASWVARIPAVRDDLQIQLDTVGVVILGMSIGSIIGLTCSAALLARFGARLGMIICLSLVAEQQQRLETPLRKFSLAASVCLRGSTRQPSSPLQ